jgi:hypothetical protein
MFLDKTGEFEKDSLPPTTIHFPTENLTYSLVREARRGRTTRPAGTSPPRQAERHRGRRQPEMGTSHLLRWEKVKRPL